MNDFIHELAAKEQQVTRGIESPHDSQAWPEPQPLPDELLSVQRFDCDMLPESLRPWIVDIAERLQCPMDFPAVAAMIALAGIVGRKLGIRPMRNDDWLVVPNLWGAIVGRPGLLKTPSLREPLSALRRLEADAKSEYDLSMREHEQSMLVAEATEKVKKEELKNAVRKGNDTEKITAAIRDVVPSDPVRRRYLVNDCTIEKLGELLKENPNGVVVFRDELTGFLRNLDKQGQESARAFYLESWNGDGRFVYDRIGRGTVDIPCAIVSLIGGIQPGPLAVYLRRQANGMGDDGLLQRIQLLVWPDAPSLWKHVDRAPDQEARTAAFQTYERLDRLEAVALAAERDKFEHVPYLHFDNDAQEMFNEWREELERRLRSGEDHPTMESHLAKYRSLIPSLALLIHLADEPNGGFVTVAALSRAIRWGRYLETHARRMYASVSQPAIGAARLLGKAILDGRLSEAFTQRGVYKRGWSGLTDREEVAAGVDLLVELDWLLPVTPEALGRPKTTYHINPRVFSDLKKTG